MDLPEQIANALLAHHCEHAIICEHTQVIEYGAMAEAVMAKVQPALDAKDTENARLKATIARVKALCAELMTIDPAELTRAQRRQIIASVGRAVLAALDQPGDQEGTR